MFRQRNYHWRLDPTTNEWQFWLQFADIEMSVIGLVSGIAVSDAEVDVKKLFADDVRDKIGGLTILTEV